MAAFGGYPATVWLFEPWMITFGLLLPFLGNILFLTLTGGWSKDHNEEDEEEEEDAGGENKSEEGEKKSLKEKMQAMQDIALQIQTHLGFLAHVMESIKNVFNFSVPFLSWLAFVVVFIITVVLYLVPLRWDTCLYIDMPQIPCKLPRVLLLIYGTHKFTKKLVRSTQISW